MPPYSTLISDPDSKPELRSTYVPTPQEEEAIRLVTGRFKEAEEARRSLDEVWLQCVAMVQDKQWHRYDWASGTLQLPKAPTWRIRATHNLIKPKVNSATSALLQDIPLLDVDPMSNQPQDIAAARVGRHVLKYFHERLRWERLYTSVARWEVMTGTAFIKTFWDPGQQDVINKPPDEQYNWDQQYGIPMLSAQAGYTPQLANVGQVATAFCSPFEMYPQPGVQAWPDVEWVIHAKARTLEYIRQRYGAKGELVGKESETANAGFLERRVQDLMEAGSDGSAGVFRKQGSAVVMEYWEKPCPQYPQGRQITVANGVVLRMRDLPYRHLIERRMLPFTCFVYEPLELRVWGQGLVESLIPLQREYNRIFSDLLGILKTSGMPRILWPIECGPQTTAPTSQPGQIIRYMASGGAGSQGLKPEHWQPSPLGGEWLEMLNVIKADMEDIAERHQPSSGGTVPGLTAGVAIQLTINADNQSFGPKVTLFHESLAEAGQQALGVAKEFITEQRLMQIVGDDPPKPEELAALPPEQQAAAQQQAQKGQTELMAFSGSDLPDYADVKAKASNARMLSGPAKTQQIFDLYDRGAFGQPGTPPANKALLEGVLEGENLDVQELVAEQLAYQQAQQVQQMQQQMMQQQMQAQQQASQQQAQGEQKQALQAQQAQQQAALQQQKGDQAAQQQQAGQEAQMMMQALRAQMQQPPGTPQGLQGLQQ